MYQIRIWDFGGVNNYCIAPGIIRHDQVGVLGCFGGGVLFCFVLFICLVVGLFWVFGVFF